MAVKRIVTNIRAETISSAEAFYGDILGMEIAMDHGWIVTFTSATLAVPQISIATEGGSGADVPEISIEVDNLDQIHERVVSAGIPILYGPATEPWGVRRFYVRDPFGRVINILAHA